MEDLDTLIGWMDAHQGSVQAISTIILVLITARYVGHTRRLAHVPHLAYIRPLGLTTTSKGWQLSLENFGPGVAANIEIRIIALKGFVLAPTPKQPLRGYTTTGWIAGDGPPELSPGTKRDYEFEPRITFNQPFTLRWTTLTGKRQKSWWKFEGTGPVGIKPATRGERIRFQATWTASTVLTPLVRGRHALEKAFSREDSTGV